MRPRQTGIMKLDIRIPFTDVHIKGHDPATSTGPQAGMREGTLGWIKLQAPRAPTTGTATPVATFAPRVQLTLPRLADRFDAADALDKACFADEAPRAASLRTTAPASDALRDTSAASLRKPCEEEDFARVLRLVVELVETFFTAGRFAAFRAGARRSSTT